MGEAAGELRQQAHFLQGLTHLVLPIMLIPIQMVVDQTFGQDTM